MDRLRKKSPYLKSTLRPGPNPIVESDHSIFFPPPLMKTLDSLPSLYMGSHVLAILVTLRTGPSRVLIHKIHILSENGLLNGRHDKSLLAWRLGDGEVEEGDPSSRWRPALCYVPCILQKTGECKCNLRTDVASYIKCTRRLFLLLRGPSTKRDHAVDISYGTRFCPGRLRIPGTVRLKGSLDSVFRDIRTNICVGRRLVGDLKTTYLCK